jgi:hypothetical protein
MVAELQPLLGVGDMTATDTLPEPPSEAIPGMVAYVPPSEALPATVAPAPTS